MTQPRDIGPAADLPAGTVRREGPWAVGNAAGAPFAVSRRCRHFGADLSRGTIDRNGCLVCPWHGARYDVASGRMVRGPQGIFAKVPGLDAFFEQLTRVAPLRRTPVREDGGRILLG